MNTNSNAINFGTTVSLAEFVQLLITCGHTNNFLGRGEPGIGKSSSMRMLEEHFGSAYAYAYFDCINKDLGDIVMPSVNHDLKVTEYFPNQVFQLQSGKPCIIMLDEFTKAFQPIKNMLHPMLEARNPRLGDIPLPKGSIVFLTGNLLSDGVGDDLKAHSAQRVTEVTIRKPNADEWLEWAVNNGVNPVICAWVHQFPHCLDSYLDYDIKDEISNPYIYNPRKVGGACVSNRTLEKAGYILDQRHLNSANATLASMIGTVGAAAARDIDAYVQYQDQLPSWDSVVANPKTAKVPDAPGACAVMVFGAVTKVDRKTIAPWMDYIERLEPEWQAAFAINIAKNPAKQQVAFTSTKFRDWVLANEDIL